MHASELLRALDTALSLHAPPELTAIEQLTLAGWWVLTRLVEKHHLTPQEAAVVMLDTILVAVEEMEREQDRRH